MKSIAEIYQAVKNGAILENLIPPGSDARAWVALLNNYDPTAKPRKRTTRKASGKTQRSRKAAMDSVVAAATLTLVSRVNDEPAIPNSWYTVNRGEFTASVDRQTNEVSYKDNEQ